MQSTVFATASLPSAEQFGYWRDVVWQAFTPVELSRRGADRDEGSAFEGCVRLARLGPVLLAHITSEAQNVSRTTALVRRMPSDGYFLNLPLSGRASAVQGGSRADLEPGDFTVVDASRPFQLHFPSSFVQLSLYLPAEVLTPALGARGLPAAAPVDGSTGIGALVSTTIRTLPSVVEQLSHCEASAYGNWLAGAIALSLGSANAATDANRAAGDEHWLWHAALGVVERRHRDAELSPADVAASIGVSVRYLHRLFADQGTTFGTHLLTLRLSRCRDELADSWYSREPIAAIAARHGFADASYFARVFRARYGLAPRDCRPRE